MGDSTSCEEATLPSSMAFYLTMCLGGSLLSGAGEVYTWGFGGSFFGGQGGLGHGDRTTQTLVVAFPLFFPGQPLHFPLFQHYSSLNVASVAFAKPTFVEGLEGVKIVQVSAGTDFTLALAGACRVCACSLACLYMCGLPSTLRVIHVRPGGGSSCDRLFSFLLVTVSAVLGKG